MWKMRITYSLGVNWHKKVETSIGLVENEAECLQPQILHWIPYKDKGNTKLQKDIICHIYSIYLPHIEHKELLDIQEAAIQIPKYHQAYQRASEAENIIP